MTLCLILFFRSLVYLKKVIQRVTERVTWLEDRIKQCHKDLDALDYSSIDISRDLKDKRKVDIFVTISDLELLVYDLEYLINSMESDIEDYPEDIVKDEKLESKFRRTKVLYRHIKTFLETQNFL